MRQPTRRLACAAALAGLAFQAQAVTEEQFTVRSTHDIIEVCTTPQTDPLYTAAANFCQGYLVGAYHYQDALYQGPGLKPVVCLPEPKPSRNQAIAQYIDWAKAHPEYAQDLAVNTLSKFLAETWPCKQ